MCFHAVAWQWSWSRIQIHFANRLGVFLIGAIVYMGKCEVLSPKFILSNFLLM